MTVADLHYCKMPEESLGKQYGWAVSYCHEDNKFRLFVENGEYENQVNFCPICGFEARVKING